MTTRPNSVIVPKVASLKVGAAVAGVLNRWADNINQQVTALQQYVSTAVQSVATSSSSTSSSSSSSTSSPVGQAYYTQMSAGNVSLTSGTIANILSLSFTMPSTGGPYRILISYQLYWTSNNQTFYAWVSDGVYANASAQVAAPGTNTGGIGASQISQATYTSGQIVTLTLQVISNGSGSTIKQSASQSPSGIVAQTGWMSAAVVPMN